MFHLTFRVLTIFILSVIILSCSTESTPVYQLTVSADPPEAGTVSPATAEVEEGESIQITATANEHWVFERWGGDHSGTENPVSIVMDADKNVTALFEKQEYPLTIDIEGEGSVSQQVIQSRTTDYPHGTLVELTAEPDTGWKFVGWSGDVSGEENPVTVTVEDETTVTATFERIEYPLTIEIEGQGEVEQEIVSTPKTTDYPFETVVELMAIPAEGWVFTGWDGDLEGSENPQTITITEEKNVTAVFERDFFDVLVSVEGEGEVDIDLESGQEEDGGYESESVISITAFPKEGWIFSRWEGDLEGSENPQTITITEEINVTAVFERDFFEVSVSIEGDGEVDIDLESGQEKDGRYEYESALNLTAVAEEGWKFESWKKDEVISADESLTVVVEQDLKLTAIFQDQRSVYSVKLGLSDGRDTIELYFGQDANPTEIDEQSPPAPPSGVLHGFFERDGREWWSDFRDKMESTAEWTFNFQRSESETLTLSWDIEVSKKIGTLILRDLSGSLEIDMSAVDHVMLDEDIESPLRIEYDIVD